MSEYSYEDEISLEDFAKQIGDQWDDDQLADRTSAPELNAASVTINWRAIEDDARDEACRALADWVQNWLVPRYELKARVIPDCWWQHGEMVEELSALHSAWQVAFDSADGGYGPIGWHERFALARTRDAFRSKCVDGHRAERPRAAMPPVTSVF